MLDDVKSSSNLNTIRAARVTHVTTNHPPFDTRIFLKECVSLADSGFDVSLVVPHTEMITHRGVQIVPIPPPKSRRQRFFRSGFNALKASLSTDADIFHLHDPDLLPIGWILKVLGKRVIYDAHEDRPKQVLSKEWIPRALRPFVAACTRLVESASATLFDAVVAATPAIQDTFPAHKTVLVQNYPILGELISSKTHPYQQRQAQIIFVGLMNWIRGIKQLVDAMAHLPERLNARLVLIGTFSTPQFQDDVKASPGWVHTQHLGQQGRNAVASLLGDSRIGVVTYLPEPNHIEAQPNKLFEYMSAAIPVVASDFPLWRAIVDEAGCGILVDPNSPEQIANAIEWLIDNPEEAAAMGKRGQEAVSERLNWGTQADVLLKLYERLTA